MSFSSAVRFARPARAALALGLIAPVVALVSAAPVAAADEFVPADGPHSHTVEFGSTGAEQTFVVPDGVTEVTVGATGAPGGVVNPGGADPTTAGGRAARVTGAVTVTPGQVLVVRVGGAGRPGGPYGQRGDGGWNGGGNGGSGTSSSGSGGGGATDLRTCAEGDECDSLGSRLVVAAGGGGSGAISCSECPNSVGPVAGGDAGAAGSDYWSGRGPATGGQPGTADAGGAGGVAESGERIVDGSPGSFGLGGHSTSVSGFFGGGGGGAGWYGGGSAAVNQYYGVGGGGGSSLVPAGGSTELVSRNVAPGLTITYDVGPVTDLAVEFDDPLLVATGHDSTTVTATATAGGGEPIAGLDVSFASTDAGHTFGAVTDHGDGTYSATLDGSTAVGTATVTATAAGSSPAANVSGTAELVTEGYSLTVAPFEDVLAATGSDSVSVRAWAVTESEEPVEGLQISFSSTDAGHEIGEVSDEGEGVYTATLTGTATVGTATISVAATGAGDPSVTGAELKTENYTVAVHADEETLVATGKDETWIVAQAATTSGKPVDGLQVSFSSSDEAHEIGEVSEDGWGTYGALLRGSTTVGTATISATVTGAGNPDLVDAALVSEGYTVTVKPFDRTLLAWGGDSTTVTAEALSDSDVPVEGLDVSFTSTDPGHEFGPVTDQEDGTYTATLTGSATPGTATISAVVTGAGDPEIVDADLESDPFAKPTVTAALTSSMPPQSGWYRAPVTVSFTCAGTRPLTAGCPSAVVLGEGRNQSVARTVTDDLGFSGSATGGPVNIDLTRPSIAVEGARNGAKYPKARKLKCQATDALSGVASCTVTTKQSKSKKGKVVSWTATAVDVAGNTATSEGRYTIKKKAKKKRR